MIKPLDFGIAIPALGVVIVSFFVAYTGAGDRSAINLKAQGGQWVFPANAVETMRVSGPLGDTLVEIRGNMARITASPCVNQTCVAAGDIHAPGQWIACLPNHVMVYIDANYHQNDVDATVW